MKPKGKGRGNGRQGQHGKHNHGDSRPGSAKQLRSAILDLRKCQNGAAATSAAEVLKSALTCADKEDCPVDGPLIGMAAAHARRIGRKDVLDALCAYACCRLAQFGGREVAELCSAAAQMDCDEVQFFAAAANYCYHARNVFASLRDVSLMCTALVKRSASQHQGGSRQSPLPFDCALAFSGLSSAANQFLTNHAASRDLAEFIYALSHIFEMRPLVGGAPFYKMRVAESALVASIKCMRRCLHTASPQDIAKLSGAVSAAWQFYPHLQEEVLRPCINDVAQAARFNCDKFNAQDLSFTIFACAKLDIVDDVVAEIFSEQVVSRMSDLSHKDLCLMLWVAAHAVWAQGKCTEPIAKEVERRDLTSFSVQDLCMAVQALARIGDAGKAALCICFSEALTRQLHHFYASDKAHLLWAIAKSKVLPMALCEMIVRSLSSDKLGTLPQKTLNALLWSLAVLHPSVPFLGEWLPQLMDVICKAAPWEGCTTYEVANAAWAFIPLQSHVSADAWKSLAMKANSMKASELTSHSLCNLLRGFALCPTWVYNREVLVERFATEVVARLSKQSDLPRNGLSGRDWSTLASVLVEAGDPLPSALEGLCAVMQANGQSCQEMTNRGGGPDGVREHMHCPECPPATDTLEHCMPTTEETSGTKHAQLICKAAACHQQCCPPLFDQAESQGARLNTHCDFPGHCVQLKNTFIHVVCSNHDESTEDCTFCRMSRMRSRSCDTKDADYQ
jgi:hypothetical protein